MKKIVIIFSIILLSSCSSSNKEANPGMSFASFYEGSPKEVLIEDEKPEKAKDFSFTNETDEFMCTVSCVAK